VKEEEGRGRDEARKAWTRERYGCRASRFDLFRTRPRARFPPPEYGPSVGTEPGETKESVWRYHRLQAKLATPPAKPVSKPRRSLLLPAPLPISNTTSRAISSSGIRSICRDRTGRDKGGGRSSFCLTAEQQKLDRPPPLSRPVLSRQMDRIPEEEIARAFTSHLLPTLLHSLSFLRLRHSSNLAASSPAHRVSPPHSRFVLLTAEQQKLDRPPPLSRPVLSRQMDRPTSSRHCCTRSPSCDYDTPQTSPRRRPRIAF
jgi:hypothetical protein